MASTEVVHIDAQARGVVLAPFVEAVAGRSKREVTLRAERATPLRLRAIDTAGAELKDLQTFVLHDDGNLVVPVDGPGGREFALLACTDIDVIVFGRVEPGSPWLRGEQRLFVPTESTTIDVVALPCEVVPPEPPGNDVT
ncbi:MAG: hypothetical protein IPH13_18320 [Planctomycetes bacterium]|nr:hypothetical protein [Planctomycetota bacterium]